MTAHSDIEAVVTILFEAYMDGYDQLTTKELAARLGVSPATAQKRAYAIFDLEGWKRITITDAVIPVHESNYKTHVRDRQVTGWTVTKRYVMDRYLAERAKAMGV